MCYIESFYIQGKKNWNTFTVPFDKSKTVSFASSIIKNIVACPPQSIFPVKLICCIAFRSTSSSCCLLVSIAIIL